MEDVGEENGDVVDGVMGEVGRGDWRSWSRFRLDRSRVEPAFSEPLTLLQCSREPNLRITALPLGFRFFQNAGVSGAPRGQQQSSQEGTFQTSSIKRISTKSVGTVSTEHPVVYLPRSLG